MLNSDLGNTALLGNETYFSGVHIGSSNSSIPYIYSENGVICFRYIDENNSVAYTSTAELKEKGKLHCFGIITTTSFQSFNVLANCQYYILSTMTNDNRPLASTIIDSAQAIRLTNSSLTAIACYAVEPSNYRAEVYFSSNLTKAYMKSISDNDIAVLYGVI